MRDVPLSAITDTFSHIITPNHWGLQGNVVTIFLGSIPINPTCFQGQSTNCQMATSPQSSIGHSVNTSRPSAKMTKPTMETDNCITEIWGSHTALLKISTVTCHAAAHLLTVTMFHGITVASHPGTSGQTWNIHQLCTSRHTVISQETWSSTCSSFMWQF